MLRQASSILFTVVLHAIVLALALWMLSRREPPPEIRIGSVPVTIVSDVIRNAAPTPAPSEELFDEVTPDASDSAEPEATETPTPQPTPTPPSPTPQRQPTPPQRPQTQPQRPTPSPQRPQTQPTPPSRPQRDALNLDNLTGGSGTPSRPPGRAATESGSGDAPALTGPQVAAIGQQVIPHWNLTFCEMAGGDNLTIRIRLTLSSQGRITRGPTLVEPESGSVWRVAAEAAQRAARAAEPFDVPDGFPGREFTFTYRTANACP